MMVPVIGATSMILKALETLGIMLNLSATLIVALAAVTTLTAGVVVSMKGLAELTETVVATFQDRKDESKIEAKELPVEVIAAQVREAIANEKSHSPTAKTPDPLAAIGNALHSHAACARNLGFFKVARISVAKDVLSPENPKDDAAHQHISQSTGG